MIRLPLFTLSVFVLSAGCSANTSQDEEPKVPVFEEARSSLERDTSTSLDATDAKAFREANTAFALRMHNALAQPNRNVVLSPYSLTTALAMTYAGARGETATEMATALRYDLGPDKTHIGLGALDRDIEAHAGPGKAIDGSPLKLALDNTVFVDKEAKPLPSFLDLLALRYGAGTKLADFRNRPDEERLRINDWVSANTNERVPNLLPERALDPKTRLVLVNTVYMNAAWATSFRSSDTADGPFLAEDGTQTTAKMMAVVTHALVAETDNATAVTLKYDGSSLAMTAILPKRGSLADFERSLDARGLDALLEARQSEMIGLTMPRFRIAGDTVQVDPHLKAMGMKRAFEESAADFTGIRASGDLYIKGVFHKAFLEVSEKGTEAAAATGVSVVQVSAPVEPSKTIKLDRPFMALIRDEASGAILFTARVAKP